MGRGGNDWTNWWGSVMNSCSTSRIKCVRRSVGYKSPAGGGGGGNDWTNWWGSVMNSCSTSRTKCVRRSVGYKSPTIGGGRKRLNKLMRFCHKLMFHQQEGAAVAEWLSSWLAEQEDRGSIPGLATWIFRDWLSPASKSRYGWKIAKSTLIKKKNKKKQPSAGQSVWGGQWVISSLPVGRGELNGLMRLCHELIFHQQDKVCEEVSGSLVPYRWGGGRND